VVAGIAILAVLLLLGFISSFYVDVLWFREVHQSGVYWGILWTKLALGVIFGLIFFILLVVNLFVARRLRPRFRVFSPEQEIMERYRVLVEPYANQLIPAVSAVIALLVGVAAAARWQTFLLWHSAGPVQFGVQDPVFHRDPSYYIFILPFWQFVQGWLFSAIVGVTLLTALVHYLNGGIRVQSPGEKVAPQVKAHLSVLLGLLLLVKAWGYYLGQFNLLVSSRGVVTGASYTDIHAQLPALRLLVVISLVCGVLFLVNIRLRGWAFPVIAIALLGVVSIVAGGIYPEAVQRFSVAPQEFQREKPYIQRDIQATRYAFGLNQINEQTRTPTSDLTAAEVQANDATISNIRLWNPDILKRQYLSVQRIQPYYEFQDVDVDRYQISDAGGSPTERVVMMSPREVSQAGIPSNATWQNTHLVYTHGYGAVASLANSVTSDGSPTFLSQDVPQQVQAGSNFPTLDPKSGAQVYFGEGGVGDPPYLVVDTKQPELNYQTGQDQQTTHYAGKGGIPVGGFFRQLVFAYRYRDFNLLISGLINSNSRILINRDISTRIEKIAPFLKYDGDPYAAVVGGRLVFIRDAYTSTNLFPYSERMLLQNATNGDPSGPTGEVNYIRNSVKVVVDAYDGTVKFYVVDPSDPLIQVWQRAFPDLFETAAPSTELAAHFRYPESLLQVQATQFATYHVTDPQTFYSRSRQWDLPDALPSRPRGGTAAAVAAQTTGASLGKLRPYYVVMKLPNDTQGSEQFYLFEPFTPVNRQNMVSYIAAASDGYAQPGSSYGKLTTFEFPTGVNIDGPQQVRNIINQDPVVSPQISLLNQQGSHVVFGDLLVVPIEDGFLYVQPVFVESNQGGTVIPELKKVVVVHGQTVTISDSLVDALAQSFGEAPPTEPGGPPPTGGQTVEQLLQQALTHFANAEKLLRQGDLAGYQREIGLGQQLVQQAQELAGTKGGSGTGTTSPSPSPSPSPSGSPSG
jgi:uncharacterized membrane protein (UPF0182 family)